MTVVILYSTTTTNGKRGISSTDRTQLNAHHQLITPYSLTYSKERKLELVAKAFRTTPFLCVLLRGQQQRKLSIFHGIAILILSRRLFCRSNVELALSEFVCGILLSLLHSILRCDCNTQCSAHTTQNNPLILRSYFKLFAYHRHGRFRIPHVGDYILLRPTFLALSSGQSS